jgi:hypothetical protein
MNDLIHSCRAAATYPKNIISPGEYQHSLQAYLDQLDRREAELFDSEDKAVLDFWDLEDGATGRCQSWCIELEVIHGVNFL